MMSFVRFLAEVQPYRYSRPFIQPLEGAWDYWFLLMLPLCLGVAIVYKSVRCHSMRTVPWEAAMTFIWIVGGIALAAVGLVVVTHFM